MDELDTAPPQGLGFSGEDQPTAPFIKRAHQRQQFPSVLLHLHEERVMPYHKNYYFLTNPKSSTLDGTVLG